MKLYIKQKVFAWSDTFVVKDELGNDKYFVKGEFLSLGHKLHVYNNLDQEVGYISQRLLTLMPRFDLTVNGEFIGQLVKKFRFFQHSYYVDGTSLELEGEFLAHEYSLSRNNQIIMTISKEWFTWGDSYVLDILNPEDELLCLCVTLAVDCEMCSSNNS